MQTGLRRCQQRQHQRILRGSASRPAVLPRYVWAPLKAAAGQATVVKLQTDTESQLLDEYKTFCMSMMSKHLDFHPPRVRPVLRLKRVSRLPIAN